MKDEPIKNHQVKLNIRETHLLVDLNDKLIKDLTTYSGRINSLLINPKVEQNKNLITLLDDLLGAVYSLILSEHNEFEDRENKQIEEDKVNKRASDVEKGIVRLDGKWIAGWHFNSALYRIASVYHRTLKIILNDKNDKSAVSDLIHLVDQKYDDWTGEDWRHKSTRHIYNQVNKLKHGAEGIFLKRIATRRDAKYSIYELLHLIEKYIESI